MNTHMPDGDPYTPHSHGDGEHAHYPKADVQTRVTAVPAKAETARKKPSHF